MSKKYLYDNNLPFQVGLDYNIDGLRERITEGKASLIIIDGFMGEGKTTLATECGDYYQGSNIDLVKQIAYGGEEFIDKLIYCYKQKLPVLIYDEAGDFSKRGTQTKFNQTLNRAFEVMRGFKVFIILCLPSFNALDSKFIEEGVCRFLLHTHDRNNDYGNYKGYDLVKMYKVKHLMLQLKKRGEFPALAYKFVKPNFRGEFLDLQKERANELDNISTSSKVDLLNQLNSVNNNNLFTYKDLADKLLMSVSWVKKKSLELNLEAVDRKKNVSYFESSVLALLMNEVKK